MTRTNMNTIDNSLLSVSSKVHLNTTAIKGSNFKGVFSANEFLIGVHLLKTYQKSDELSVFGGKNIIIAGSSDITMDAARCAKQLGGNVVVVCSCAEDAYPAGVEEMNKAKAEGIRFLFLINPLEVKNDGNGNAAGLYCEEMRLTSPNEVGFRKAIPLYDSEFEITADYVILAF